MLKISVGQDELGIYDYNIDENNYEWLVYYYENHGYEGYGEAVGLRKSDGKLLHKNLDHCSCYGPMDAWETSTTLLTKEEFLRDKDSIHDFDCMEAIKTMVRSLLT